VNELLADDLLRLRQEAGGPRLSLFLPLSPGSPRSTKTRIRAKNLLDRAEKALRSDGVPSAEVTDLVGRVRRALDGARPMNDNHRGLAVFADPDDVRAYDVPLRLPELAAVGDRFTLAPLLATINLQGRFFLLALTQDRIRLFEGTALTLEPVDLEGRELAAWATMPPRRAAPRTAGARVPRRPGWPGHQDRLPWGRQPVGRTQETGVAALPRHRPCAPGGAR
jgi:hypothetical protein